MLSVGSTWQCDIMKSGRRGEIVEVDEDDSECLVILICPSQGKNMMNPLYK